MWIGYTVTGFLAGTISGMGIGGGALLIPALGIFFGIGQQSAQSINLLYFMPTAAIAIITHRKKGNIQIKGMLSLIVYGLIGAAIGASLAMWINADTLKKIFGFFLLVMGIIEFFKKEKNNEEIKWTKKGENVLELTDFEHLKLRFRSGNVDEKIDIYVTAEGLTQTQYKELLKLFPLDALSRLEEALA